MNLTRSELVSAVIPTRNRPDLVTRAVLAALHQTYSPMEVIVVVDGEDKSTEARLAEIDDLRLRVISLSTNVGGSEARNIGVRTARGAWVAFLDDDDEWLPQKIALQMRAARASESVFPVISSRMILRSPARDFTWPRRLLQSGEPLSEYLFCRREFADRPYAMQTSTLFMRRETMLAVPFRTGLKMHQDWDWLLRASCYPGVTFEAIPEPLTVLHAEDARAKVGRNLDWQFSLRWAHEMRPHFTRKAYSFFVATECFTRAVKSKAGAAVYTHLVCEFLARGSPTLRSLLWLAAFTCFPHRLRACMRDFLRRDLIHTTGTTHDSHRAGSASKMLVESPH